MSASTMRLLIQRGILSLGISLDASSRSTHFRVIFLVDDWGEKSQAFFFDVFVAPTRGSGEWGFGRDHEGRRCGADEGVQRPVGGSGGPVGGSGGS
mmetsp:Transcript_18861/g.33493  ORF Transcript_18861/g.33493 Transcript_18861/m.33493 type:complete len:96 (-) Transcript_18861:1086-1373(-)